MLTKDMQTEQLLYWSGMADTEHTTFDSNEEAVNISRDVGDEIVNH